MPNIAILIPTLKKGGAEKQAVLLKRAFEHYKLKVSFILFNSELGFDPELYELGNFTESDLFLLKGNIVSKLRKLVQVLKRENIDIIFSYLTATNLWGCICAKTCGIKHIYTGIRNAYLELPKRIIEYVCARMASGVIFNNFRGLDSVPKYIKSKSIVIPNCYSNPHEVHHSTHQDKPLKIITVARFSKQKDYTTALHAIKYLVEKGRKITYIIIGYGKEENNIRKKINQLNINEFVKVIINPSNIFKYLCDSDIYLSTSLFEGTSNSIMEALDAELPIIATNVGDNDKLIKSGYNGFLNKTKDYKGIAENIDRFIISRNLVETFGKNSKRLLIENYSFDKFANTYYNLIK